jgi:hypothetical protein
MRSTVASHFLQTSVVGEGYYCIYCRPGKNGIIAFPLDGGRPLRINEAAGLPANKVSAMAWLDKKLYVALYEGYLIRWDPHGRTCEVLASSRSKERRSRFDDCTGYCIPYMVGDPQRHRLLLTVHFRGMEDDKIRGASGLWQFESASKRFKQLFSLHGYGHCGGTPVQSEAIMLRLQDGWVVRLDLKTDTPTLLHGKSRIEMHYDYPILGPRPHNALYPDFSGTGPPYTELDGWLWAVRARFARMSKATGAIEPLPSLETGKPGASYSFLEPIGDGSRLIVGDDSAFWLLTLKEKSDP